MEVSESARFAGLRRPAMGTCLCQETLLDWDERAELEADISEDSRMWSISESASNELLSIGIVEDSVESDVDEESLVVLDVNSSVLDAVSEEEDEFVELVGVEEVESDVEDVE